ncbi:hypothetical protein ACFWWM_40275 [Streptomyces sp. NPDC058682]|uniref:hypothetical protein n=1 Tax=Streptomyces sp. NPDC058682 TaxID=3346596 RepID=UPI0036462BFF
MNEWGALGLADEKLTQEAAEVAVSWVLAGELTHEQSEQLIVGDHLGSHTWVGEADRLHRWVLDWVGRLGPTPGYQRVCASPHRIIAPGRPTAP